MSLNIRELSPELAKKAQEELNEVPERLADDVQALKDWIGKQAHLRARTNDQHLVNFLRGSKHSLERAKEKLDLFYTIRSSMPEIFSDRDPMSPRNLELIRLGTFLPLPKTLTPDGPRIILMRVGAYDTSKFSIYDIFRAQSLVNSIAMYEDDNMVVAGQVGFIDMQNASMSHLLQMTPSLMKKLALMSQEAVPIRMKGYHHVNSPKGFETLFNMFKAFMNEKNKNRVSGGGVILFDDLGVNLVLSFQMFVHGDNMEAVHKHIPKHLLPVEYGGENGTTQDLINYWEKKIISYRDFLLEEANFGTDESKRIGPNKHSESLFGVEGSFRKLNVD